MDSVNRQVTPSTERREVSVFLGLEPCVRFVVEIDLDI